MRVNDQNTDCEQLAAELLRCQQRLDTLMRLSSDWYWELDNQHRFARLVGFAVNVDPSRLLGLCPWELSRVEFLDGSGWAEIRAAMDARQPVTDLRVRATRTHGETIVVSNTAVPVFDDDGRFTGYCGITRDITRAYLAEEQLRESEARFRSLTQLSSDWYWEQDAEFRFTRFDGQHVFALRAARTHLGRRRWELGGEIEGGWEAHRQLLAERRPFYDAVVSNPYEGRTYYISISGEPMFDRAGHFIGYRGIGRDITERREAEERVRFLANHDSLTRLPNRAMFSDLLNFTIQNARRNHQHFAVLFIDLDRFKVVNDSLGHAAGDQLLQEMARRLTDALRAGDVVARLGGDEFVVLALNVAEREEVAVIARKLLAALVKPVMLCGQECRVTASIGICLFPEGAQDEPTLMKHADIAMYRAKEDGKNTFQFYSKELPASSLERFALEADLRSALERGQLLLHYQPKLDLRSGAITGVEALLRWQHPELGMILPGRFIPLAEETGLIIPIGRWVLATACRQAMAWRRAGLPPLRMAVNLSMRQFADEGLLETLADVLNESGLPPALLELELTEGMVMQNVERAVSVLTDIKRMGVRIAIDDFGVGYSALAQIKRFPIETLKVDRSFVRDLTGNSEDRAIIRAIITMGRALGLKVVAEGVETAEQAKFLRERACDESQGFYFSRPLAPAQLEELVRRRYRGGDGT